MVKMQETTTADQTTHTVVEFSSPLVGFAGRILAEAGLRVLRVPYDYEQLNDLEAVHFHAGKEIVASEAALPELLASADGVIFDSSFQGHASLDAALEANPHLIKVDVTPYGEGPWQGRAASDLSLLAAGGVLGSCGYDSGQHAGMPIAPTGGQAANIAGMLAAMAMLAAIVNFRSETRQRSIEISAQQAISVSTEMAVPYWSYQQAEVIRHTGRHAMPYDSARWQHLCKDGTYLSALPLYIDDRRFVALKEWMASSGFEHGLGDAKYDKMVDRSRMMHEVVSEIGRFAATRTSSEMFEGAQERGLPWAPVLTADDCAQDSHFRLDRESFNDVSFGAHQGTRARMP